MEQTRVILHGVCAARRRTISDSALLENALRIAEFIEIFKVTFNSMKTLSSDLLLCNFWVKQLNKKADILFTGHVNALCSYCMKDVTSSLSSN